MDSVETPAPEKTAFSQTEKSSFPPPEAPEELSRFVGRHIGPNDEEIDAMLAEAWLPKAGRFHRCYRSKRHSPDESARSSGGQIGTGSAHGIARHRAAKQSRAQLHWYRLFRLRRAAGHPAQRPREPGWYTAYTPYQAEIAQGRLEALLNFQTMITDLTALDIANASLLDEATAAAEAMTLCHAVVTEREHLSRHGKLSSANHRGSANAGQAVRHPGRSLPIGPASRLNDKVFGVLLQYPDDRRRDYRLGADSSRRRTKPARCAIVAADPLALTLLRPPGEMGADVAVGSTQRFGVPLGFGGPHAAYMATRDRYKRHLPGRLVGVSHDAAGRPAYRLSLQTREQHIRRDKATSNICTAQVLLAVMASMYAVYHGPDGLRRIARRVHELTCRLADGLEQLGYSLAHDDFFDTVRVDLGQQNERGIPCGVRSSEAAICACLGPRSIGISLDEATTSDDIEVLLSIFGENRFVLPGAAPAIAQFENRKSKIRLSHSSGFQHARQRDRDAALHPAPGVARSLALSFDDSARLLHHEVERHGGDVSRFLAGVFAPPSLRA